MDSRLMNAYHDDPYDPNYERYECDVADAWSTDNIVMENMALTDTLNGILPMSATETDNEPYCNIFFPDEHIFGDKESNNQNKNTNVLIYDDFEQQHLNAEERVVTIETTDFINNGPIDVFDMIEEDRQSLISLVSYRTRTDSSSIGDYESHSSDYDDTDDDDNDDNNQIEDYSEEEDKDYDEDVAFEELEADDLLTDLPGLNLLNSDQFMFTANGIKQRTMSTNTIGSDVDAANFDLAEFITKDDHILTKPISIVTKKTPAKFQQPFTPTKTKIEKIIDESDSDIIVDVETVELEDVKKRVILLKNSVADQILPDDNLEFVDNVKSDPEWNPKEVKLKTPSTSKKIVEASRGKGKNNQTTMPQQNNKLTPKKQILKSTQANVQKIPQKQQGLGRGGKNLALLKRDCESIEKKENTTTTTTKSIGKDIALIKHDSNSIVSKQINNNNCNNNTNSNNIINLQQKKPNGNETEKRKLNLEEYKRRYGEDRNGIKINQNQSKPTTIATQTQMQTPTTPNQSKPTTPSIIAKTPISTTTKPPLNPSPIKINKPHSEAVTSIVKTLKEQQQKQMNQQLQQQQQMDPITLAKNKVLRMQELKRKQQMKIIDSTISAKVPRVTKLLPLQEIIKDTAYAIKNDKDIEQINRKQTAEYEKIVMVSVGCNTILTFSPKDVLPNVPLLDNKSRAAAENIKISHNSLITSIQDAIVKQNLPKNIPKEIQNQESQQQQNQQEIQQQQQEDHGENRIIMHLPKDQRLRQQQNTRCMDVQTDFQAAFPNLPLPKLLRKERHSRRRYRKNETSSHISALSQSEDDDDFNGIDNHNENGGVNNLNQNSVVVSTVVDYPNSEINGCGTSSISSRSSRRHRSSVSSSYSESGHQRSRDRQRRTSFRKSMRKHKRSSSRSSSSSGLSDYDRSRSRNRRTRSRSPFYGDSNVRRDLSCNERNVSKPAVEERRIVYVGRIEEETSKEMLRRKFITYGSIRQITIHYKENNMKYGFVTFERSEDAFAVIDNSTRDSQINMYDISFGGRRAFCRTSYADLDNAGINNYQSYVFPTAVAPPKQEDSFEALLQKVKAKMNANKSSSAPSSSTNNNKL